MPTHELVVLLDEHGDAVGNAIKAEVHDADTALHLALSCYLMNAAGELLLTRRALTKRAWPGVWTNSFCGHPAPGESLEAAAHRRAWQELGVRITSLTLALPDFRYRAIDSAGIVENEICPVFVAHVDGEIVPDPTEVLEWEWVSPACVEMSVGQTPFVFSPWMRDQLPRLSSMGAFGGRDG